MWLPPFGASWQLGRRRPGGALWHESGPLLGLLPFELPRPPRWVPLVCLRGASGVRRPSGAVLVLPAGGAPPLQRSPAIHELWIAQSSRPVLAEAGATSRTHRAVFSAQCSSASSSSSSPPFSSFLLLPEVEAVDPAGPHAGRALEPGRILRPRITFCGITAAVMPSKRL